MRQYLFNLFRTFLLILDNIFNKIKNLLVPLHKKLKLLIHTILSFLDLGQEVYRLFQFLTFGLFNQFSEQFILLFLFEIDILESCFQLFQGMFQLSTISHFLFRKLLETIIGHLVVIFHTVQLRRMRIRHRLKYSCHITIPIGRTKLLIWIFFIIQPKFLLTVQIRFLISLVLSQNIITLLPKHNFYTSHSIQRQLSIFLNLLDDLFLNWYILFHEFLFLVVVLEEQFDCFVDFLGLDTFHHLFLNSWIQYSVIQQCSIFNIGDVIYYYIVLRQIIFSHFLVDSYAQAFGDYFLAQYFHSHPQQFFNFTPNSSYFPNTQPQKFPTNNYKLTASSTPPLSNQLKYPCRIHIKALQIVDENIIYKKYSNREVEDKKMRRTFEDHAYTSVKELELLRRIFGNQHPIAQLDRELEKEQSLLFQVSDEDKINKIRDFISGQLEERLGLLESSMRNGEIANSALEEAIYTILTIQRRLLKNVTYKKQLGTVWGPIYLGVLVWSSKMALSEEVLRIISQLSFDKSLKLFYYYFKYYMSHLNLFYPDQIKIKHLFITTPTFNFGFIRHSNNLEQSRSQRSGPGSTQTLSQPFIINIPDIRLYFEQHSLTPNHYTAASLINQEYRLGLQENDEIFHALMVKIKILLNQDKNSVVRTVLYAAWVFGGLDLDFVQSQKKIVGMPDIFELPPDYAGILEELIQIFFEPNATPETHLAILTYIDGMLTLQQKTGHRDFYMSLNENTTSLLKLMETLITSISLQQTQIKSQSTELAPILRIQQGSSKNKELVEKFMYLICKQILEATQIHNLAEELATIIFTKKINLQVTEKTIQYCGQILITVQADEQQLLNYAIAQIKQYKQQGHSYFKVLNMFFTTKHVRQRRDLTLIARSITQSEVFTILLPIIQKQCESTLFTTKSFTYTAIILIGNICSQNPSLVDQIAKYQIFDVLLEFLMKIQKVDDDECINAINFIHYICLKEGDVRNKHLVKNIQVFIRKLIMSNLYEHINYKNFSVLSVTLNKLLGNIPSTGICVFFGITQALKDLNQLYKQLMNLQKYLQPETVITAQHYKMIEQITILDSKLIIAIKLIQKCKQQIFSRARIQHLNIMYRRLIKLCFVRTYSLIDFPGETRMMVNLIHDLRILCDKKNRKKNLQESQKEVGDILVQEAEQNQMEEPNIGLQQDLEELREDQQKREDDLQLKNLSSQEEKIQGGLFSDGSRAQETEKKPEMVEEKDPEKSNSVEMKDIIISQMQKIDESISKPVDFQSKPAIPLNFLSYGIKNISKTLQDCFGHPSFNTTRMPRRVLEILTTEPVITAQVYLEMRISISISKLDRLIFYLIKESLEELCKDFSFYDMCMSIQALLPNFVQIISLANVQFLNKNLPTLKNITIPLKYTNRSETRSQISAKKIKNQLNNKSKQKLLYYYGFLISVMKCIGISAQKQGQKYIQKLIQNVIEPFSQYTSKVLSQIQQTKASEVSLLQIQKLKNIVKMYLQLFCAQKKKHRQFNIFMPYNNIFMYYILYTAKNEKNNVLEQMTKILNIIGQMSEYDKQEILEDTVENRFVTVRRVQMRCVVDWAHEFVVKVFQVLKVEMLRENSEGEKIHIDLNAFNNQAQASHSLTPEQQEQQCFDHGRPWGPDQQMQHIFRNNTENKKEQPKAFQVLLFAMHKSYKIFAQMRKSLGCHIHPNIISLNKIRSAITYKFLRFMKPGSQVQTLIDNQQVIQLSQNLVNTPGIQLSKKEFKQKMIGVLADLSLWMDHNFSRNIVEQDHIFIKNVYENIPYEEIKDVHDKIARAEYVSKKKFMQLCQETILISKRLFTSYNIQWHFPSYKKNLIKKSIKNKLQQQKISQKPVNIRQNVLRLSNIVLLFYLQINMEDFILIQEYLDPRYTNKFVVELVKFVSEVIGNYETAEGEDKYRYEANQLVKQIMIFLNRYLIYRPQFETEAKRHRNQKKRLMKKSKSQIKQRKSKKLKIKRKQPQETDLNLDNQNQQQPEQNRDNQRLRRNRSQRSLNYKNERLQTPRTFIKRRKQKQTITSPKKKINKGQTKLVESVQNLLINILAASETNPYLTNQSLHTVTDFIIQNGLDGENKYQVKRIKVNVAQILPHLLRVRVCEVQHEGYFHKLALIGYSMIGAVENRVNLELGIKRIFYEHGGKQVSIKQWLKRMQKVEKLQQIRLPQLSYLLQIKVPNSIPEAPKTIQNSQQNKKPFKILSLTLNQNRRWVQSPIQQKQKQPQQQKQKQLDQQKQKQPEQQKIPPKPITSQQYQFLPYTEQNIIQYKDLNDIYIVLAPNVELNMINYNLSHHSYEQHLQTNTNQQQQYMSATKQSSGIKDRKQSKSSHGFLEDQGSYVPIKAVQYVPNKSLQAFIHEIINNYMRLVFKGIEEVEQELNQEKMSDQNNKNEQKNTQIFTLTIMAQAFIVLFKQSPCLVPYITKYKCRKLILQNIEHLNKKQKTFISNLLNLDNKKQITFLGFLIRAGCPLTLNTNFNIIFSMCLDSTVIQKEKIIPTQTQEQKYQEQLHLQAQSSVEEVNPNQNQGVTIVKPKINKQQTGEQSFVSFGHVVRQKTLLEIQECLGEAKGFIRRISIINLMTKLFSIKQFSRLCIEATNFLKNLQQMYVDTFNSIKNKNLPQMSIIAKKLLIPFYTNPVAILLEINVSLQLQKKQKRKHPRIELRLLRQQIEQQLTPSQFFHSTKFKQNWPYTTVSQISYHLADQHLEDYQLTQSSQSQSDSSQNQSNNDSQLDQEELQEYLQNAELHDPQLGSQDQQDLQRQIIQQEQGRHNYNNDQDQYTNSWINYDVIDDLMGIDEQEREDEEEGDGDGQDDENLEDVDGPTIEINLYPEEDDQIIEEVEGEEDDDDQDGQQLDQQELDGQDQQDLQSYSHAQSLSHSRPHSELQQLNPSSMPSPNQQPSNPQHHQQQQHQIQLSISSSEQQSKQEQLRQHIRLRSSKNPQNLYKYFNELSQMKRDDHRNYIYRTQAQQDQLILLILSIYVRGRNEVRYGVQQVGKYPKMQIEDNNFVQDHEKILIALVDDYDMLAYAERIEYVHYYKCSEFQWKMPPTAQERTSDTESLENQEYLLENTGGNRGRLRSRIIMMNADEDGGNQVRVRRNGVIISPNARDNLLNHIRNAESGFRDIEFNILPESGEIRGDDSEANQRSRGAQDGNNEMERIDEEGQMREEGAGDGEGGEEPIQEQGSQGLFNIMNMHDQMAPEYMLNMGQLNSFGLTRGQINAILENQGFSVETFLQMPPDLQADILQNVQLQGQLVPNRQSMPVPGQSPNYPMAEPNTPVLQPRTYPNIILQASSEQLRQQQQHQQNQQQQQHSQNQPQQPQNQHYKKLSNHHLKKINKDIIYLLNRDGKNNNKFLQSTDEFIECVFELIYILTENDFIYFPFSLLACMCINSHNQSKILSNMSAILIHGPHYKQIPKKLPHTIYTNNQNEYISNYEKYGYTNTSLKILYIMLNLSKSYSISISMLYPQNRVTENMDVSGIWNVLDENTLLQNLIGLFKYENIKDNLINMEYLLGIIKNVTVIKFNYHVHTLVTKEKEKQKEKQRPDRSKDASLQLTQQNNSLLFSLLESDFLKQNAQIISKIIMRLSLDEKNFESFVHYFKKIIRSLAIKITKSLTEAFQKYGGTQSIPHRLSYKDKLYKSNSEPLIVRLMMIFYEIIKSMKKSIKTEEKNANLLQDFRQILECDEIKELCQRGCQIIEKNPSSSQLLPKIHEFVDCFFAIFNILGDKQQTSNKQADKQEKSIKYSQSSKKALIKRKFNSNFINLENLFQKKLCTPQGKAFINANIRNKLNSALKGSRKFKQSLLESPIILVALETPHMLQFDNKKSLFKVEIKRLKQKKTYGTVYISINRKDVFQQSFTQIMNRKPEQLKGKLKIQFEGEQGQDVGGLTRQWFQLLSKQMFNPNYALFIPSSTGSTYQPYSKSYVNGDHLNFFKFIGRVMGKALHDGFLLDAFFTPAFYKHILSLPITYEDMEEQDFEYYKSLKWILENSPIQDYMQLNFTYEFDNFGQVKTQNLVPNGDQIQVTDQNKIQYVQLISTAKMAKSVQKQYESLLQGFHQFIPAKLIRIFDEKQLQIMISGLPTVDIEDLRRNTDLVNYSKNDKIIIWLFQVLESFDMSLRTAFVQFVTGTSRVPPEGFKALQGFNGAQKFNIHKYYDVKHLPRSHTCFNQLDLPPYETKQILIEKLTLAITEGKQGFGML